MPRFYHIRLALKHPNAAMRYLLRRRLFIRYLGTTKEEITKYFTELISEKGALLRSIEQKFRCIGLETGLYTMRQTELYILHRVLKPEVTVETGVENGISSFFILQALEDNGLGRLYSIDVNQFCPNGKKIGWLIPSNLRHRWKLVVGHSLRVLPTLCRQLQQIDVFIHDSEHTYHTMLTEYSIVYPVLRKGGILISDDTGRNEAFIHFSKKINILPNWTRSGYGILRRC